MEGVTTEDDLNDSTIPIHTANNLLRGLLCRRKHYEVNCRYIAKCRDRLCKDIPINQVVPLAFHTTPSLLESFRDIAAAVQAVLKQYKSDLFNDWQKYCKALDVQHRAVATFEGAIYFAAENIPQSEEREAWISSCSNQLSLLKQLASVNEGDGSGRKRKRGAGASDERDGVIQARSVEATEAPAATDIKTANASNLDSPLSQTSIGLIHDQGRASRMLSPKDAEFSAVAQAHGACQAEEASQTNIAMMAEVDKLESTTLGGYLFKGMDTSRMRQKEKDGRMIRYTDTVRLHLAYRGGEDFKLEVWLCSSVGEAISEAKMRSVEDLGSLLGDYLFEGMKASRKGMSGLNVSPSGDDSKLEVMLSFVTGKEVYEHIYPRVS